MQSSKKLLFTLVLTMALAVLGLSACAGGSGAAASSAADASASAAASADAATSASADAATSASADAAADASASAATEAAASSAAEAAPAAADSKVIRLSTTTSVNDSGLLPYLQPTFEGESGYTLEITSAGTGAAIKKGETGDADLLLVHAKASEE